MAIVNLVTHAWAVSAIHRLARVTRILSVNLVSSATSTQAAVSTILSVLAFASLADKETLATSAHLALSTRRYHQILVATTALVRSTRARRVSSRHSFVKAMLIVAQLAFAATLVFAPAQASSVGKVSVQQAQLVILSVESATRVFADVTSAEPHNVMMTVLEAITVLL